MKPKEDQHVVVGEGTQQRELEDGTDRNKQGYFKANSDKSSRGKSYCC